MADTDAPARGHGRRRGARPGGVRRQPDAAPPGDRQVRPYPASPSRSPACGRCSREARSGSPGRRGTSRIRSPSAASPSCTGPSGMRSRSRAASSRSSSTPPRRTRSSFPTEDRIVSVANFEILPLAAALDFLRIALAPALTTLGRAAPEAPAGTAHRAPGRARTAPGTGRELAGRARRHRAGADRGGAASRSARLLRARDDDARGGHRGPHDDGPARRPPAGRDGRARRVGGRHRARDRRPGGRPAPPGTPRGAAPRSRTPGSARSSRSSPRATCSYLTSTCCRADRGRALGF